MLSVFFRFDVTRIIPTSDASSSASSEHSTNSHPAKKRRIHKNYELVRTFSDREIGEEEQQNATQQAKDATQQAKDAIAADNFTYFYRNESDNGVRVTYRCKFVKSRGTQCEADAYLLYDSRNDDVHYYRSVNEHTHENHLNSVNKISTEVEVAIREMYEADHIVKPSSILHNLGRKGMTLPSKSQLQTVLKKIRSEKFGNEQIHLGTLDKWLSENTAVPSENTQPYIVDYEV